MRVQMIEDRKRNLNAEMDRVQTVYDEAWKDGDFPRMNAATRDIDRINTELDMLAEETHGRW